jgi:4-oxalocrotonate tautomerase family enzyme
MPFIKFYIWPVTTVQQRAKLAKGVTQVVQDVLDVPAEAVTVFFDEIPQDCWAMAGKLAGKGNDD